MYSDGHVWFYVFHTCTFSTEEEQHNIAIYNTPHVLGAPLDAIMATEVSPLVSHNQATSRSKIILKFYAALKKRYRVYVYPKGAYVVLLYCTLVFSNLHGSIERPMSENNLYNQSYMYMYAIALPAALLYPLVGVLGMYWSRYTMINAAVVIVIGAKLLLLISLYMLNTSISDVVKNIIACFMDVFYYYGIGTMVINFIPFGIDQLLFASSEKIQSYGYWMGGLIYLTLTIIGLYYVLLISLCANLDQPTVLYHSVLVDTVITLLLLVLSMFLICCCKKHINIELPSKANPVKHIYKVMKYAWLNKYPARRSAYTYTERPSRLDLCKERYGGPFTTDEVEDVKSFWRILVLLFSMFGLFCFDVTIGIADNYYQKYKVSYLSYTNMTFAEIITILCPSTVICSSIGVCILMYQLIVYPFLSRYLPRLLYRMGMGLFIGLCASCCLTLLSLWLDRELFPYGLLAIPQVLYGCAYFLSFITTIEFIIAQSPLRLQGMLLGTFMLSTAVSMSLSLTLAKKNNYWQYYAIKSILTFLSCLTFLVTSKWYKYRERNELTDVNEHLIIAEYTERQLASKDEDDSFDIHAH